MSWTQEVLNAGEIISITPSENPSYISHPLVAYLSATIYFKAKYAGTAKVQFTIKDASSVSVPATAYYSKSIDFDSSTGIPKYPLSGGKSTGSGFFTFPVELNGTYFITILGLTFDTSISGNLYYTDKTYTPYYYELINDIHYPIRVKIPNAAKGNHSILIIPFTSKYSGNIAITAANIGVYPADHIWITASDTGIDPDTGEPLSTSIGSWFIIGQRFNATAGTVYYAYIDVYASPSYVNFGFMHNTGSSVTPRITVVDLFGRTLGTSNIYILPNPCSAITSSGSWGNEDTGFIYDWLIGVWQPYPLTMTYDGTTYKRAVFDYWEDSNGTYISNAPYCEFYRTAETSYTLTGHITLTEEDFNWDTAKVSELPMHLTLTEWNDFICYMGSNPNAYWGGNLSATVNCDNPDLPYPVVNKIYAVEENEIITAAKFNKAIAKVNACDPSGTAMSNVSTGDIFYASYLNTMLTKARVGR